MMENLSGEGSFEYCHFPKVDEDSEVSRGLEGIELKILSFPDQYLIISRILVDVT